MISFVPGVYSGLTAEPGNGKRGGSRSYPSDFMDDHGPLTCLDDDTFRETVSILRLFHATYRAIVHFKFSWLSRAFCQ